MANMTFKADLLPNSDYGYSLGSATPNSMKRWIVPGTTVETIIGTQTGNTGSWTGTSKTIKNLYDGLTIRYFLPYSPSGNATLNLTLADGTTTGAINCYYSESRLTTHYGRGSVITLTYFSAGSIKVNGTATADNRWIADANYADGNDVNVSRITYPRLKTGAIGIGRYSLFMETSDGTYQGLTSTFNSTGTSHVKNTAKFKLGRVYYSNRGSDVAANTTVGDNSWVDQQTGLIDLRYSTNCGTTLTSYKPVYLVGAIGTDGYFTLADTWYSQTEPTTEDGKVYIYLGMVYPDTTPYRVAFEIDNPVYWYKNNGFRLYGSGRGISGITRSGTTFTVTRDDGSTFTFTQQDNNTWRGIQDNLTSDSATDSLSAKQGKALANGSARDSTKLPLAGGTMTGAIKRYYSAASTDPVLSITSNDKDATALWMGHGTAAGNPSENYYKFLYKGTGLSPNNYFQLIAGVASNSEVVAMQVNEQGNVSFTNTVAASISGNAATASKLATARTISLTGSVTGSGSFDGSGNLSIATTTNHHHNTLTVGNKTYNGSSDVTIEIADLGLASTTTFLGLTSTNLSNGSTTNPVTITIGPTTGSVTATNGSVVMEADSGEEYIWSGSKWNLMGLASSWALANHIHGNITNAGTITSDTAKASGQHLVITDSNNKICRSAITLGTATNTYLRNDGSWATLGNAATATKLATARNINGTAFDGSTDITTANWGTARTITIGSTGKSVNGSADVSWSHNEIGASVSNTWANGTTAGPTLSTTVNGVTGTAVAIPNASDSASGIVTTGAQTFAGKKTFGYIGLKGKNNANEDVRYCSITLHNGAGTQVGEIYYDIGNATNITSGQYIFRQFSPNSTVNTSTTGFYENFQLPVVTAGRTANATYQILTTKDYTTLDGRYVNIAGDTMTGDLYVSKSSPNVRCIDTTNNNLTCTLSIGSGHQNHGVYSNGYAPSATTFTSSAKWIIYRGSDGETHSNLKIFGAVWNDYAEYRETKKEIEPGRCVCETGKGDLILTNKRMQEGCEIVSDTFGFAIGESEKCKTPTAATGRVLAYLHEDRELAKPGRPVCSGPNGTVSLMTNKEAREYPWCIIGTISEIPDYEIWHAGSNGDQEIKVNGRIWIRIR